jgi:salicylate hydroxylase
MQVLTHLGLDRAIAQIGVRPKAYVFKLYDTGEEIQRFALSEVHERLHGAPYYQIHRADLHDILAAKVQELDHDTVRLSHRVVGFQEIEDGVSFGSLTARLSAAIC